MRNFIISKKSMQLLNDYRTSKTKGDDIEEVAKEILSNMKYEYSEIKYEMPNFQYLYGDLLVLDKDKSIKSIDIKASHTFKNIDKLGLDVRYVEKGTLKPYIPSNATTNEGYLYHLQCDSIIAINPYSKKLYIVNNFQKLKKELLKLIHLHKNKESWDILEMFFGVELAFNKTDYNKDTLVANVDFKSMELLGADVIELQLMQEYELRTLDYNNKFEYDILNLDKKNTPKPTKAKSIS